MDLSGTDRSAVRLGYGSAILPLLAPDFPAPVDAQAGPGCPYRLLNKNNIGNDLPVSCRELVPALARATGLRSGFFGIAAP